MTIARAAQSTTYLASETLRTRVGQAGATSQAALPEVSSRSTSMEEITASASVIYRQPKNEISPDNVYVPLDVWVHPASEGIDLYAQAELVAEGRRKVGASLNAMDGIYRDFKESLKMRAPDLAEIDFGFTINPQGDLIATGVSGQQKNLLSKFLNETPGLKELASNFANNVMGYSQVEPYSWGGVGRFKLNTDNFEKTIDVGQALDFRHKKNNGLTGLWLYQFEKKGVIDFEKKERMKPIKIT